MNTPLPSLDAKVRIAPSDRLLVRFSLLCELFDLAPRTARQHIAAGLPHLRIEGRLYFKPSECLDYFEQRYRPHPVDVAAIVEDVTCRRTARRRKGAMA